MSLRDVKYASQAISIIKAIKADKKQPVRGYSANMLKQGLRTFGSYLSKHGADNGFYAVNTMSVKWVRENIDELYALIIEVEDIEKGLDRQRCELFARNLKAPINALLKKSESGVYALEKSERLNMAVVSVSILDSADKIHIYNRDFCNREITDKMPKASFLCGWEDVKIMVSFDGWGEARIPKTGHKFLDKDLVIDDLEKTANTMGPGSDGSVPREALDNSLNLIKRKAQDEYDNIVRGA